MKIMLVTQLPPPSGGIATWSEKYVNFCAHNSIKVDVVNNAMIGKRGKDFSAKRDLRFEILRTWKVIIRIIRVKLITKIDVVHFNTTCSPNGVIRDYLCALLIGKKIPIILHCRCTVQDQLNGNKLGIFFFKRLARRAKTILVLNNQSSEYVLSITRLTSRKISNFIDEKYLRENNKDINNTISQVLFTGHVQKSKGIDEIISVASVTPNIKYVLAGQISAEYREIVHPSNVVMTGNLPPDKILELLDASDVFLFPSYSEGFANSLNEAMARGLPCIVSDTGANLDMLEGKGGVIVPVADSGAILEALAIMAPKDVRIRMSKWNIRKVQSEYVISKVMEQLILIYSTAIENC